MNRPSTFAVPCTVYSAATSLRSMDLGPYLALKLVGECGTNLSAWPNAKHFTSWLCLSPSNKISGGKVLSSRTRTIGQPEPRRCCGFAAVCRRTHGHRVGSILPAPVRARWQGQAVTATARKIAVPFYNNLRHGMEYSDPGASQYEERQAAASSPISREGRSRSDMSCRPHPRPAECFLGIPQKLQLPG